MRPSCIVTINVNRVQLTIDNCILNKKFEQLYLQQFLCKIAIDQSGCGQKYYAFLDLVIKSLLQSYSDCATHYRTEYIKVALTCYLKKEDSRHMLPLNPFHRTNSYLFLINSCHSSRSRFLKKSSFRYLHHNP